MRWISMGIIISFIFIELASGQEEAEQIQYPAPPPFVYRGLYPCSTCHRDNNQGVSRIAGNLDPFDETRTQSPDTKPRLFARMHRDINLDHGEGAFWCLNCHNTRDRDYLTLLNGKTITFDESHQLCGQCHGSIYRDWKLGIHGRRVGQWDGKKLYLLCAHCHNPHSPKFRKLPGLDPPMLPSFGRERMDHSHD